MIPGNLFAPLPQTTSHEVIEQLTRGGEFRLERIVSTGQTTPADQWYDQPDDEWVVLLSGAARLRFADDPAELPLQPGDWLHIPAHRRHRVEWTSPAEATVWLALHYRPDLPQEAPETIPSSPDLHIPSA